MIARDFDEAFAQVQKLVQDFQRNEAQFLAPAYNETAVREVFINRFWMALGWDVTHETQKNPHACEVSVEKNVNVEGRGKRADYSFAVAPNYRDVRFFVEAKKPSRQLDNAQDYFQTIRYGWHARTPVAVLMDFQQFRVLDCRYKPDIDVVLQYGALEKFHYTDYADEEKFRRLYHLFSREDVGRGALEEYVAGLPKPGRRGGVQQGARGAYQSIDESFLQDLDAYREQLARAFKQGNAQLDGAQLTEATQRTLDRLVFMRFLEDKLIETDELVERFAGSRAPWAEFIATSRRLDRTYNGIIFKEHALLDAPTFRVDERAFAGICENLSHTRSPYDFNLIPIHILGSIYERFLGKTIVVDAGGATVVEKPEVRKAGGVYYTPEYIVRYIVEQTVGKLIAGKTPEGIRPLRFADISCGSGSFLLGVFDLLLTYHAGYYNRNKRTRAEGLKAGCTETDEGTLRLSLLQKRTLLLNNIYGVDVDAQAVEVAQLSLYLKLLEAETTLTTRTHQLAFREALLPSLGRNIISGNSLVDFDILSGHLFEPEAERKLNPMNFAQEFPHVMRDGGFDAIVGNPPYIRIQTMQETSPMAVDYYKKNYTSAGKGNYDIYVVFVERALKLLNERGLTGYILPHKFFNAQYGAALRKVLADGKHLSHIVHFGDQQVFEGATTYTCLLFLSKANAEHFRFVKVQELNVWRETGEGAEGKIATAQVTANEWTFNVGEGAALFKKLNEMPVKLGEIADRIFQGLITGADPVFILTQTGGEVYYSEASQLNHQIEKELMHPLCKGSVNLRRYYVSEITKSILFPYELIDGKAKLLSIEELSRKYPHAWSYLSANRSILESRERGKWKHEKWYAFGRSQNLSEMEQKKILTPSIANRASFTLDIDDYYYFVGSGGGGGGGYGITVRTDSPLAYEYILGLLNSKLLDTYLKSISSPFQHGYYAYNRQYIEQLPIRTINFSDPTDKARHDRMVSLVEGMLAAKRQLAGAGTEAERNLYERKCANLDAQIDTLVYELYALTPQEIELVEAV